MLRTICLISLTLITYVCWTCAGWGAAITWIGGNANWDGVITKWNPNDEPDSDDQAIFNAANTVDLANAAESIMALTMSGGIDLLLNGNDLTVNGGNVSLSGAGTLLDVPTNSVLNTDDVFVSPGASLTLHGGTLTMAQAVDEAVLSVGLGGAIGGFGTIRSTDVIPAITSVFNLNGNLTVTTFDLFSSQAGTLAINIPVNGRAVLDFPGAVVDITRNDTLDINGNAHDPGLDPYAGTMNLSEGATLDMSLAWGMSGGSINANTNGINVNTAGTAATIAGGTFTQTGGTINLPDNLDSLRFSSPYTSTGGTINNNGLVIFNNTASMNGADFQMNNADASLEVADGNTVTITQGDFDLGGTGANTNVTTIGDGAVLNLRIDFDSGSDDVLDHTIELNGGELDVINVDDDIAGADTVWHLNGGVLNAHEVGSILDGGDLIIQSETINVDPGAILFVNTTAVEITSPTITVDGDLNINAPSHWTSSAVNVSGTGIFRPGVPTVSNNADVVWNAATVDWDDDGPTTIEPGSSLTINANAIEILAGTYDSTINIDSSDLTVNTASPWRLGGTLNIDNVSQIPTINGSRMIVGDANGATVNVGANGGAGIHDMNAPLTLEENGLINIAAGATFQVDGDTIFEGGQIFGGGNYAPASTNTVNGNTLIFSNLFNFDRGLWTINTDATLTVDVVDYDSDSATNSFNSTITIDGGHLDVIIDDAFVIDNATINMNGAPGTPAILGSRNAMAIGNDAGVLDANIIVGGSASNIHSTLGEVTFFSDANVTITAGASLFLNGATTNFNSVNGVNNASFTGEGAIFFDTTLNINEETTFSVSNVYLKTANYNGQTITINADTTINTDVMGPFGAVNNDGEDDVIEISDDSRLIVNIAESGHWTLNPGGTITYNGDANIELYLDGSPILVNGTINHNGDGRVQTRLDIGSSGIVNILTANEALVMAGGDNTTSPNTMAGGTINGPGYLDLSAARALLGFGSINADVNVFGPLKADNGILNLNGAITGDGILGTADADGILNVANAWNTSVTSTVELGGGELRGATITNGGANGINGHGLVSARVINNSRIDAEGGALIVETAANNNDWDGAGGTGQLNAISGDLEIRDDLAFPFTGSVVADVGRTVLVDGFEFQLQPGSTLTLTQGTYRSIAGNPFALSGDFGGTMTVNAGGPSRLRMLGGAEFLGSSTTSLQDDLLLETGITFVRAGATFTGAGALVNLALSGGLAIENGVDSADLGVLIRNNGSLVLGKDADFVDTAAQVSATDFEQASGGSISIELGGLGLDQFDRLDLTGMALLDGELRLRTFGGYVPALGNTFDILSAAGGLGGTVFADVVQPNGMPVALEFNAVYTPTLVQLIVDKIFSADFDLDGDVDGDDLVVWQGAYGAGAGADADGDGDSDGRDLLEWQGQYGSGLPLTEITAVPEPPSLVLLSLTAVGGKLARRRRILQHVTRTHCL